MSDVGIISLDDVRAASMFDRIKDDDSIEDQILIEETRRRLKRTEASCDQLIPLDAVMLELGISEDDLDEVGDVGID